MRSSALALMAALALPLSAAADLEVVTTTPDLGSLVRSIGGEAVDVTVFVKGPQDAHFVEPRPSFIRKLHDADLFVLLGMDMEVGWAPALLKSARNRNVQPGSTGYLDASVAIQPLELPAGHVDRSMGDLHAYGNPHYLTDPVNGVRVARLIRERLATLEPAGEGRFGENLSAFEDDVASRLVGDGLATELGSRRVIALADAGELLPALEREGRLGRLGGWLGAVRARRGARAVQDHRLWPYFAHRFGIELIDTLEPLPGLPPTSRHLQQVVTRAQAEGARGILASTYFDPRHARWVSEKTGIPVVPMAHQPGAREGTDDYVATVDYNVRRWLEAF
jgi:ABC-type Zn uptake system ZnuABC Zn-binding protein ZnuA